MSLVLAPFGKSRPLPAVHVFGVFPLFLVRLHQLKAFFKFCFHCFV